jgi:hypothetical protein
METHHEKVFKYKLDFYYQSALIYLLTLVVYGGIRGSFIEREFRYVLDDPIMYVILFFVVMSFGALALNAYRQRRLVITDDAIIFKNRFHERHVKLDDIEWMHIGREARVQTSGRFQVIVFKLKGRRRLVRIRIGRYEKERELLHEARRLAEQLPARKKTRWRKTRFTDR